MLDGFGGNRSERSPKTERNEYLLCLQAVKFMRNLHKCPDAPRVCAALFFLRSTNFAGALIQMLCLTKLDGGGAFIACNLRAILLMVAVSACGNVDAVALGEGLCGEQNAAGKERNNKGIENDLQHFETGQKTVSNNLLPNFGLLGKADRIGVVVPNVGFFVE